MKVLVRKPSRTILSIALGTACALISVASADAASSVEDRMNQRLSDRRSDLVAIYHDLHRHPEVAGEEKRTAGVVAERLRALGLEVRAGVGGHGVVGTLKGGEAGGVVAFRADMDAVVSSEHDPVDYRSAVSGVRHICGHDVHTTVGLAIAEAMAAVRDEIPGTLVLIFQPAEESATGARAMIADGAISDPAPDAIFAYHVAPLAVGQVGSTEGLLLPPTTMVGVTFTGEGDLEALVDSGLPLFQKLTDLVPASTGPGLIEGIPLSNDFVAVQPFASTPGPRENQWTLQVLIRGSSDERFAQGKQKLVAALDSLTGETATYAIEYVEEATSGAYNDPALVRATDEALRAVLGEANVVSMGGAVPFFSEDFGQFQKLGRGAMYWLGASNPEKGLRAMPHAPDFAADEEAIFVGARAMSAVLLRHLTDLSSAEPGG